MLGLVPSIHDFLSTLTGFSKTWILGTRPRMTASLSA
jgi:hypothetical protein